MHYLLTVGANLLGIPRMAGSEILLRPGPTVQIPRKALAVAVSGRRSLFFFFLIAVQVCRGLCSGYLATVATLASGYSAFSAPSSPQPSP